MCAQVFRTELTKGQQAWEEKQKFDKEKLEPSLAEKSQAETTGIAPEQRREEITAAYEQSDTAEAFRTTLEQKGYVLSQGGIGAALLLLMALAMCTV